MDKYKFCEEFEIYLKSDEESFLDHEAANVYHALMNFLESKEINRINID